MSETHEELELVCVGPVTSALLRALEYGVRVRSWTLAEGGRVALRTSAIYESYANRWWREGTGRRPGDCISVVRVLEP